MEKILVVKRKIIAPYLNVSLNNKDREEEFIKIIEDNCFFHPRDDAETNISLKQIIPYVLIRRWGSGAYFMTKRLNKQKERRLHGMLSLGIGGHIEPIDKKDNIIMEGLKREISEEINITYNWPPKFLGIINDDENDVGKVHLGLAYEIEAINNDISVKEKDKMEGRWVTPDEINELYENLESWSKIIFKNNLY